MISTIEGCLPWNLFSSNWKIAQRKLEIQSDPNFVFPALPHELLLKIFSYLSPNDLTSCTRVNRLFHQIGTDEQLWKKIYLSVLPYPAMQLKQPDNTYRSSFAVLKKIETAISKNKKYSVEHVSDLCLEHVQANSSGLFAIYQKNIIVHKEWSNEKFKIFHENIYRLHALLLENEQLFWTDFDHGIYLWDLKNKQLEHCFNTGEDKIRSLVIAEGFLYAGAANEAVYKWDLATKKLCYTFRDSAFKSIFKIAVYQQKMFAIAHGQQRIRVADAYNPKRWQDIRLGKTCPRGLLIYKHYLLVSVCIGEVRGYSINDSLDRPVFTFSIERSDLQHQLRVYGHFLFSHAGSSNAIHVWDLNTKKCIGKIKQWETGSIQDVQVRNGELFVSTEKGIDSVSFK